MNAPLRTAIIGFGTNGTKMHGEPIRDLEGFQLVAVADPNPAQRALAEEAFGAQAFADHASMLAVAHPELVVVVTRNDQHADMAVDAFRAGAHVLVTKPWALDASEASTMWEAAVASDRLLLPWLPMRFSPEALRIREIIRSGQLGEVFLVRRSVARFDVRHDWQMRREFGGGYLLNWGAHIVEPAYWILDAEVRSVSGFLRQTLGRGDCEDVFFAELALSNGARALVEHTISPAPLPRWVVQGTRGALMVTDETIQIFEAECAPEDLEVAATQVARKLPFAMREEPCGGSVYGDTVEAYRQLERHVRGEPVEGYDSNSAMHLTHVLDAIRTSHTENRRAEISQNRFLKRLTQLSEFVGGGL